MSLKYRNLRHNRSLSLCSEGFLCGQRVGILPEFRYGLCSMAFNGCEVIAVYNALLYLGKPALLCDISFFMEKYKMLFGLFGCNPYALIKYPAFSETGSRAVKDFKQLENAKAFIITFWCKKRFLSHIHTVFCVQQENGDITAYNRYSSSAEPYIYKSLSDMIGDRKIISAYIIE